MDLEPFDFAETLRMRRESAATTIHEISADEAAALVSSLITDHESTLGADIAKFVADHTDERVVRGETFDGIAFIYYPKSRRGIWHSFQNDVRAAGVLSARAMDAIDGILAGSK